MEYDARGKITRLKLAAYAVLAREQSWTYEPLYNRVTSHTDFGGFTTIYE